MPITYDAAKDVWELTDLSNEEKKSLMSIAHEHLVNFFGVQVAERLLGVAQEMGLFQGDPDEYEGEEDANKNTYN